MFRNDYMMNTKQSTTTNGADTNCTYSDILMKQIEFNTMASGAGGIATPMEKLHRLLNKYV